MQFPPNLVAIKHLNVHYRARDHVKNDHASLRLQHKIAMSMTVAPFRLGLRVERRAEIIPATAAINNPQIIDLRHKLRRVPLGQEQFDFGRQLRQRIDELRF